jgi:hypothetical protein
VPAKPRLASINRQQLLLRSIDVEQLIDKGWLALSPFRLGDRREPAHE